MFPCNFEDIEATLNLNSLCLAMPSLVFVNGRNFDRYLIAQICNSCVASDAVHALCVDSL